jgi:hypothetical protein
LHKLRCAMVRSGRESLGGAVEVDEAYIGGSKPGKRGREAGGKVLVLVVAREDGNQSGRICLRRIPDASAKSLGAAIEEMVVPGSTVRTDDWAGYRDLNRLGYTLDVIRQDASRGEKFLPLANRVISLLKRWLLGTHQGSVQTSHLATTWINSPSDSIAEAHAPEENSFTALFNKPYQLIRLWVAKSLAD